MTLGSADANNINLIADELLMKQDPNMNLFTITDHRLVNMTYPLEGVKMEITFKRKIMSEMMTTYLPCCPPHDDHFCHHLLQAVLL